MAAPCTAYETGPVKPPDALVKLWHSLCVQNSVTISLQCGTYAQ